MNPHEKPTVTSAEVVNRIRGEIEAPSGAQTDSTLTARVSRIRGLQRDLRIEPLGGRLLSFKRLVHWFVASAFDRQAKVVEALLDLVSDVCEETEQRRDEVRQMRRELDEFQRSAGGRGGAEEP
jgi:hypothetical protein